MRIVVLDGYTLNPGDLSWGRLDALGECTVYDRTAPEDIVKRAGEAEIILTNKTILSADVIRRLTRLRYIGVLATGYNVVDVEAAGERGILVTNVPSYGTRSVAQMVFAHLLNLTQHVAHHAGTVREGRWAACPDFCYWDMPLLELAGLTLGIVGFGRIGRAVAGLARAFGMKVIVYDVIVPAEMPDGCRMAELEEVFRDADVLSLHCPLTPRTEKLVNAERLALMKPTAFLINTSRGPLIDEPALAEALNAGRLAGAGLDVLSAEPPAADNPLLTAKNCYITPHIAWATRSARQRLLSIAIDNVAAFVAGKPQNVVNG
jgi:glycerate dehydrogenase